MSLVKFHAMIGVLHLWKVLTIVPWIMILDYVDGRSSKYWR